MRFEEIRDVVRDEVGEAFAELRAEWEAGGNPKDDVEGFVAWLHERGRIGRDTFRALHPETIGAYSWWSQRFGVREKNVGWRIDLILASPGAWEHVKAARIHPDVLGSDHCPVSVDLDGAVLR